MKVLCVLIVIVLIFSMPLLSMAETSVDIITRAEADADKDVSELLWFAGGVGLYCFGVSTGSLIPKVGYTASPVVWIAGIGYIYRSQKTPPAHRLMGKSPEFIEIYTSAYKERARYLRARAVTLGCATGAAGTAVGCLVAWKLFLDEFGDGGFFGPLL